MQDSGWCNLYFYNGFMAQELYAIDQKHGHLLGERDNYFKRQTQKQHFI